MSKKKSNDVVWVIFENWCTLMLWRLNEGVKAIYQLCKQFEADHLLGAQHRTDFQFVEEKQNIENLFGEGQQRLLERWPDILSTLVQMKAS